jgi:hypothetical protein
MLGSAAVRRCVSGRRDPHGGAVTRLPSLEGRRADVDKNVIRHATRTPGATHWRYEEVLDGAGGFDGRITTKVLAPSASRRA